jgi:glycosyltransferase involved in cell wall biosynthesis
MRVAFVVHETVHLRDTEGRRHVDRAARALADAGHEVTVYCAQWWDGAATTRAMAGVTYHRVTLGPAISAFLARLPALLARDRPDVIHAMPAPPGLVVSARVASMLARAPLVVDWYGDADHGTGRWDRLAATLPSAVVSPSEMIRTTVRELGADDDATSVIPESIDFVSVEAADPADPVDVVYSHTLDASANGESLLLGLAELRDRDWTAKVIGDGTEREAYERQAADLRIDERIEFVGACDRRERLAHYRSAHAFVQTALRESFPTELLWALASGCVGIVEYQADSSAHELIENYERGFRVTSAQQLAEAIVDAGQYERLTVDPVWRQYDREAIAGDYEALYERLVASHGLV